MRGADTRLLWGQDRLRQAWAVVGGSELQPAFERGFHFTNDARIKLSGSFADEFGELHRLDALDVDVALLP